MFVIVDTADAHPERLGERDAVSLGRPLPAYPPFVYQVPPIWEQAVNEVTTLAALLSRLDLLPVDQATGDLAVALGARYGLKAVDGVHLATAVGSGADRFLTNNERDFPPHDHRDRRHVSHRPGCPA